MSGARLTFMIVSVVIMSALAFVVLRRPGTGEGPPDAPRVPAGQLAVLEVQRQGATTRIEREREREGDGYRVTAPVRYLAADAAARAAFHAASALEPIAIVTDRPARFASLEVDDGKGVRVRAGGLDLVIGKIVADGTMVRLRGRSGRDEVWRVEGDLRAIFDKSPSDWRDRTVTAFAPADAREIGIAASDGAHVVVRRGDGKGPWTVVESSVPIATLDQQVPNDFVAALSSLNASEFADAATTNGSGLDAPSMTVTVGLDGGDKEVLLLGRGSGKDDRFVKTADGRQIFLIKQLDAERVARRPIQFRTKVLCDISDRDMVEIAVENGGDSYTVVKERDGTWKARRPAGLAVTSDRVAPFASVFRGWRAPEVAEAPPPGAVARPWATISGRSKDARCTVAVGSEAKGRDGYFVKTAGSPDIYFVPKWMIERIAVPLDQLRKH
jgi:hypothetical protein